MSEGLVRSTQQPSSRSACTDRLWRGTGVNLDRWSLGALLLLLDATTLNLLCDTVVGNLHQLGHLLVWKLLLQIIDELSRVRNGRYIRLGIVL